MSRTRRRAPQGWDPHNVNDWWYDLYLQFVRGQRPCTDTLFPDRCGGWWDTRDIPGRNCANSKRYMKRMNSKMRRREAKRKLRNWS